MHCLGVSCDRWKTSIAYMLRASLRLHKIEKFGWSQLLHVCELSFPDYSPALHKRHLRRIKIWNYIFIYTCSWLFLRPTCYILHIWITLLEEIVIRLLCILKEWGPPLKKVYSKYDNWICWRVQVLEIIGMWITTSLHLNSGLPSPFCVNIC